MLEQHSAFSTFLLFIARVFMSAIFIIAGLIKVMNFSETATMMTSMGVPMSEFALIIAIILELCGSLLLLFGWYTRFGALLLLIFVILVTYYLHSFWDYQGAGYFNNMHHFFKNLFVFGSLLYVFVHGAGKFSLDQCRKQCSNKPSEDKES